MKYKGIIFDLDGTLVDSEPLHMEAWLQVLATYDLHFDHDWFEQWIGKSDRFLAEAVVRDHQLRVPVRSLQQTKGATYHQMAAERASFFPKVEEYMVQLKEILKLGIATNSSAADTRAVFSRLPLPDYVLTIVTADDVPMLKPAPDMYQLAAERIGLDVGEGVAIEDSPAGVQSAKSAGLFTLAVPQSQPAEKLQHADRVFERTADAIEWLMGENEQWRK